MKYTVESFTGIAEVMLKKHYGLELNDTRYCEPEYVQAIIEHEDTTVHECLTNDAEDLGLSRMDITGWGDEWSVSADDEKRAVRDIEARLESSSPSL